MFSGQGSARLRCQKARFALTVIELVCQVARPILDGSLLRVHIPSNRVVFLSAFAAEDQGQQNPAAITRDKLLAVKP